MLRRYWKWAASVLFVVAASLLLFDIGLSLGASCPFYQSVSAVDSAAQASQKRCSIKESATYGAARSFVEFVERGEHFFVAFGTIVIATFTIALVVSTTLLWDATRKLYEAGERQIIASTKATETLVNIERAYVAAGGGTRMRGFTRCFGVDVGNYGRTAAFLRAYDVQFATLDEVKAYPCTVSPNYPWDDQLPPGQWKGGIDYIPIPPRAEVVYGAVWYEDPGKQKHFTRFILSIGPHTTRPDVAGVDDMYRYRD